MVKLNYAKCVYMLLEDVFETEFLKSCWWGFIRASGPTHGNRKNLRDGPLQLILRETKVYSWPLDREAQPNSDIGPREFAGSSLEDVVRCGGFSCQKRIIFHCRLLVSSCKYSYFFFF